jgi:outer membrane receptor for ferrienterochelin and colicin
MKRICQIGIGLLMIALMGLGPMYGQGVDWRKVDIDKLNPGDRELLSAMYDMSMEQLDSLKATGGVPSELEKLLNSMIAVATKREMTTRHVPNIVSLITREDIQNSGARDLIDVLRTVPGFHLALDQNGKVGIGIRGNWANEGKVLLMIDGQMMNDVFSANIALGNHYPVDLIERIEILRGPGSAIYGGFATYGVINIVTREEEGLLLGGTIGQWAGTGTRARETGYGALGLKWNGGGLNLSYYGGSGQRSEADQFGFFRYRGLAADSLGVGREGSLKGNSSLDPSFLNLHLQLGNFHIRNITDLYEVTDVSTINAAGERPVIQQFRNNYSELRYDLKFFRERLTLTPKLNLFAQAPGLNLPMDSLELGRANQFTVRALANATVNWDITHRINLTLGAESWLDFTDVDQDNEVFTLTDSFSVYNAALFGQVVVLTDFVNITAGLRYDNYLLRDVFADSSFSSSYEAYAPRIALTRRMGKDRRWHLKLLASGAFRAPSIGNIVQAFDGTYQINADSSGITNVGREIEPETSLVLEAEIGRQLTKDIILTANVFSVTTRNPIVYHFYQDEQIANVFGQDRGIFVYQNFARSGSYGLELDFRYKRPWGYLNANYSFYSVADEARPIPYSVASFDFDPVNRVEQKDHLLLAFPRHKVNVNAGLNLSRKLSLNLSGTFLDQRFGYEMVQTGPGPLDVEGKAAKVPPAVFAEYLPALGALHFSGPGGRRWGARHPQPANAFHSALLWAEPALAGPLPGAGIQGFF